MELFFSFYPWFNSVQLLSCVRLFATPRTAARQASLSITRTPEFAQTHVHWVGDAISHLILCRPLLLLPPIPPSIRVFSNESALRISGQSIEVSALASVLPMNTQDWAPLEWTGWISLQSKGLSRVFSNITVQKHQFFGTQLSSQCNSHIHTFFDIAFLCDWNENIFSSPVATAEFSKFSVILSAALSQQHLLGFEIAQWEFHHLH